MFITLTDASRGKPYSLNQPIESCKQIGIRTIFMWVGWYNIYTEQTWRWAQEGEPRNSTEVKIQPGLYSFSDLVQMLTGQVESFTVTVNRTNGLINMIIPAGYQVWLPEAIRYLLGLCRRHFEAWTHPPHVITFLHPGQLFITSGFHHHFTCFTKLIGDVSPYIQIL